MYFQKKKIGSLCPKSLLGLIFVNLNNLGALGCIKTALYLLETFDICL